MIGDGLGRFRIAGIVGGEGEEPVEVAGGDGHDETVADEAALHEGERAAGAPHEERLGTRRSPLTPDGLNDAKEERKEGFL